MTAPAEVTKEQAKALLDVALALNGLKTCDSCGNHGHFDTATCVACREADLLQAELNKVGNACPYCEERDERLERDAMNAAYFASVSGGVE